MQRNLVLVVHGIGEQSAGQTIDALTGGAIREMGLTGPVDSRTEMIAEDLPDARQLRLFPCTIRQTCIRADDRNGFAQDQDILAAEVYWSDLSPAPRGAIATCFDLLRTVLTLGYLALDNVAQGRAPTHRLIRSLVHLFVWIFYALIAPMNALLLLGSFAVLTDSLLVPLGPDGLRDSSLIAIIGAVALTAHLLWRLWIRRPQASYLERSFMAGIGGLGLVTFLTGVMLRMAPQAPPPGWLDWLYRMSCNDVALNACWNPAYQNIAAVIWAFVLVMAVTWLVSVAVLMAIFVTSITTEMGPLRALAAIGLPMVVILALQSAPGPFWMALMVAGLAILAALAARRLRAQGVTALGHLTRVLGQRDRIYLPVCNAMLFLWMLFSAALWSLFSEVIGTLDGVADGQNLLTQLYGDYSDLAISTMSYIVFGLAGLVVIGAVPLAIRLRHRKHLAQDPDGWLDVWCGRVILNPVLNLLLMLLVLWIAFGGAFQAVTTGLQLLGIAYYPWNTDTLLGQLNSFHETVNRQNTLAITIVGVAGVLAYRGSAFVSAALGVARDISVYSARTLAYTPTGPEGRSSYAARQRIKARFRRVHDHLSQQYPHDRLIVIAHSQGTVIAAQSLQEGDFGALPTYLVTLGSPLTHIYAQYFTRGFEMADLRHRLRRWINIYRCDDFVGTQITLPDAPVENHRVPPAGHTGYWTDRHVWQAVQQILGRPG